MILSCFLVLAPSVFLLRNRELGGGRGGGEGIHWPTFVLERARAALI